ncbi:MAG: ABC transporter permease [Proteobacteria bacterium]|nr:ABC transporter permease [Pseudomonadota bacterium]MBU1388311.1 ABC transporter permease [Pseudomonadota bacterium]MBU1542872.1 ABC transporter permease [Pseudomonadota bacterium]MBU2483077.1 ABC transporter permease [Pseudomonadota bacterium]
MLGFIAKRVFIAMVTIFLVLTIVFFVFRMGAADPVSIMLPPNATIKDVKMLTEKFGLDKPLGIQYLNYMKNVVHGDFGESFRYSEPAAAVFFSRLPATIELGLLAFIFSVGSGLVVGIFSAVKPDSVIDRLGRFFALAGMSLPSFWVGIMLIMLFGVTLEWLPISGKGTLWHYIMPTICLSLYPIALITRLSRSAMLDALKSDYVVMARIKGVPEKNVILIHAFKNASLTLVTVITGIFSLMILGSVIVEMIFSWPGIGRLVMESFFTRDYPVVQVYVIFLTMIVTTVYLIMDIIYAYIDPRIRFQ